LCLKTEIL